LHGTSLYGATENRVWLRPEFLPPAADVSILLVRPKALLYAEQSDDPIFPALDLAGNNESYQNSLLHATALGCVDTAEIRDPDTSQTWIPRNLTWWQKPSPEWRAVEMRNVFYLTAAALDHSNTWSAIKYSSILLEAERKIATTSGTSLPLAREQWKVEARRFFDTSLALMQGRVYDIARGTEANEPGVINALEEDHLPICEMIKIPTNGWTNISLLWLVGLPTLAFLTWFTSIEVKKEVILVLFYRHVVKPGAALLNEQVLLPLLNLFWSVVNGFVNIWKDPVGWWSSTIYPGGLFRFIRPTAASSIAISTHSRYRRRPDEEAPESIPL
jgi:hypothetical protein